MNGGKQWIDSACRARVEAASGLSFALTPYDDFGNLPVTASPRSCDELVTNATKRYVTNSAGNDAGWILQGGNRLWVPGPCRAAIEASSGSTFAVISFNEITSYPLVSGPCPTS